VAAHIHRVVNGPIVVPLNQPSSGDPGASSGCVTVDPKLARAILRHPHRYYANVHTAAFPSGAVRGQLFGRFN
jgi:CHRD domain